MRPGDAFDKTMTTLRMHKVLFQQRKIDEVGGCWHKISGLPTPKKLEFPNGGVIAAGGNYGLVGERANDQAEVLPSLVKRKGRPPGSKNKPKADGASA